MKVVMCFVSFVLLTISCSPLIARENRAVPAQADPRDPQSLSAAHRYFTDVELINQDGKPMRFYSDVLQGRTVVFNFFFTHCTGVCPVLSQKLAHIQEELANSLGKDLYLVSISVDPATDTPARLREYATQFHARPGWYFLTGSKENVDFVLQKLGQSVRDPQDHTNILIVGNDRTGLWKKLFGLAKTEELVRLVRGVVNDKASPVPTGSGPAR